MKYKSGYKYQLYEDYVYDGEIKPSENIHIQFISLDTTGKLFIKSGYAWDGPSGPTIDTKNFMRGSLVHDAYYQLIREGYLSPPKRLIADLILKNICIEDGMSKIRAWYVYKSMGTVFAKSAADPINKKKVYEAP
ncbi:MAG: hypothetical protein ACXADW_23160 [Candidatus Hodarchaeales archaeon]|jgi:hypothetical protein